MKQCIKQERDSVSLLNKLGIFDYTQLPIQGNLR